MICFWPRSYQTPVLAPAPLFWTFLVSKYKLTNLFIRLVRTSHMAGYFYCQKKRFLLLKEIMAPNIISKFSFLTPRQKTCHNFGALQISEKELHFWTLQCSECICAKFDECVLSSPKTTDFRPPLGRLLWVIQNLENMDFSAIAFLVKLDENCIRFVTTGVINISQFGTQIPKCL